MDIQDILRGEQNPQVEKKDWMTEKEFVLVNNLEDGEDVLKQAIQECIASGVYALDLETTGLDNRVFNGKTEATIVGACLSPDGIKGYYIPVLHKKHGSATEMSECNISFHVFRREMKRLVESDAIAVFHNGKFDQEFLQFNGGEPLGEWDKDKKWDDTQILAYLNNPRAKRTGLKFLAKTELGMEMIEIKELFFEVYGKDYKGDIDFSLLDPLVCEAVVWYGASDAICTFLLRERFLPEIQKPKKDGGQGAIYRIEKSCIAATRWMERNRIYIDADKVALLIRLGQKETFEAMKEVYEMASGMLGRCITPLHFVMAEKEIKKTNPDFTITVEGDGERLAFNKLLKECQTQSKLPLVVAEDEELSELSGRVPVTKENRLGETVTYPAEYDIMSPQQLGLMLDELGIKGLKRTEKSKQIKTSKDEIDKVLAGAGNKYPWTAKIMRFRETQKALGTYLLPLWEDAHPIEGTIRVQSKNLGTDTGRFSTPGSKTAKRDGGTRYFMQGTPATYDPGRPECLLRVRECFMARPGRFIVAIDLSGAELRIVTNLSREPLWLKEFFHCAGCDMMFDDSQTPPRICPKCGSDKIGDLHTLTALSIYGADAQKRADWKQLRGRGKGLNFALCYGGGGTAACRATGVDKNEGWRIKNTFDSTYKGLKMWWTRMQTFAKKTGYVQTAVGRRYPVPDIKLPAYDPETGRDNKSFIGKAMRNAVNGPVQGCVIGESRILTNKGLLQISDAFSQQEGLQFWNGKKWVGGRVLSSGDKALVWTTLKSGKKIGTSPEHRFWKWNGDNPEWVRQENLKTGDLVVVSDGPSTKQLHQFEQERITEIVSTGTFVPMYDVEVFDESHAFTCDGIVVHNSNADFIKAAMVFIYKTCKKRGWLDKCRMIITMHDELVFEIDGDILEEAIEMICFQMTSNGVVSSLNWTVPLLVDVELGYDWTVPWDLGVLQRGECRFIGDEKYKKPESLPEGYDWDSLPTWPESLRPYFKQAAEESSMKVETVKKVPSVLKIAPVPEPESVGKKIEREGQMLFEYVVQPPYTLGRMEALAQAIAMANNSGASQLVLKKPDGEIITCCEGVYVNEMVFNWAAKRQGLI
jgi:DNA polymerase I-like protein with 3'-5' exonuclease and polymerase domains